MNRKSSKAAALGPPKRFAKQVNVRLSAQMIRRLSTLGTNSELTVSQLIRIAVRHYLETMEKEKAA